MLFLTDQHPLHAGREEQRAGWGRSEVTHICLWKEASLWPGQLAGLRTWHLLLPEGGSPKAPGSRAPAWCPWAAPCIFPFSSFGLLFVFLAVLRSSRVGVGGLRCLTRAESPPTAWRAES